MHDLIPKIASIMNMIKLDSPYKIYSKGTIILNSHADSFPQLNRKFNLFTDLFMYCCDEDEGVVFVTNNENLDEVNDLYNQDLKFRTVIFDSSVDDISRYEMKMYLFVNNDLKMGKGKIAGQVGHGVGLLVEKCIKDNSEEYVHWKNSFYKKVVCKVGYEDLMKLKVRDKAVAIFDMGKTQVEPNSLTVVGFEPMFSKDVPVDFASYKLL